MAEEPKKEAEPQPETPEVEAPAADKAEENKFFAYAKKTTHRQSEKLMDLKRRLLRIVPVDGFQWPDDRKETEKWIQLLKERQILLIQGVASEWVNWASQRIAMVLQSGMHRLWPGCEGIYRLQSDKIRSADIWAELDRLERPVVIVVPMIAAGEYLHNFIYAGWEKAYYDLKEKLRAANVFLILQIPDDMEGTARLRKGEEQRLYACWKIPAVRLELRCKKRMAGDALLARIMEECNLSVEDDKQLFETIRENQDAGDDELIDYVRTEVREKNAEWQLMEQAFSDDREIRLRLIFSVAFFNNMSYADLGRIMQVLLEGQTTEIAAGDGEKKEKRPLKEIWSKPLFMKKMFSECQVRIQESDNISCVSFMPRVNHEQIKKIFQEERLLQFLLTEELVEKDFLFDQFISVGMQMSLARLMVLFISKNYTTYDGFWLQQKALHYLDKSRAALSEADLQEMEAAEIKLGVSYDKWQLKPLKHLLRELLISGRDELIRMVKVFFEQLIGSTMKKKVSLGLAIDLFRELRGEGNFPEKDLDTYFYRALEESPIEEKFEVYWMLVTAQHDSGLYQKMKTWLMSEEKTNYPWTTRFFKLYMLDYFALSFYGWFQIDKEKEAYELLTAKDQDPFQPELAAILRAITEDTTLQAWNELREEYSLLFATQCHQLENSVTGIEWIKDRMAPENLDSLTLAGDVIESWAFILYRQHLAGVKDQPNEKIRVFTRLLEDNVDKKKLQQLRIYWTRKANQLYPRMVGAMAKSNAGDGKTRSQIKEKLNMRSASLRLLISKEQELIN